MLISGDSQQHAQILAPSDNYGTLPFSSPLWKGTLGCRHAPYDDATSLRSCSSRGFYGRPDIQLNGREVPVLHVLFSGDVFHCRHGVSK